MGGSHVVLILPQVCLPWLFKVGIHDTLLLVFACFWGGHLREGCSHLDVSIGIPVENPLLIHSILCKNGDHAAVSVETICH